MARNDPGAGSQDWRHGAGQRSSKPAAQYEWQTEKALERGRKSRRWRKIAGSLALASIVCAIGLLIWMIRIYRPIRVVLAGAGYESNLAVEHNARGWESLAKLYEQVKGSSVSSPWWHSGAMEVAEPRRLADKAAWEELATELQKFKGETLVLVLALHGGVDEKGAYLFLDNVKYSGEDGLLRMEDVLDVLETLRAKNKVLILEPAQLSAHWSRGMLTNEFVGRLKDLDERISRIKNLVVLCGSDVDQRSWPSEQAGLTIFNYFLMQGLRGAADDRREGGNGDRRVSAGELADYVDKKVPIWVKAAHNKAEQTPLLLPSAEGRKRAESIELALAREPDFPLPASEPLSSETLEALRKAWEEEDELAGKVPSPAVYSPQLWRQYRDTLLRYEDLLLAGSKEAGKVRSMKDDLRKQLQTNRKDDWHSAQNTLAMPAALGLAPVRLDPDLAERFDEFWKSPNQGRPELQAWIQQNLSPFDGREQVAKLAGLALNKIIENPDKKSLANTLLEELNRSPGLKPAEIHFLSMYLHLYDKQLPEALDRPKPELFQLALGVRRQAEEVAVAAQGASTVAFHPYSEQVFPWIQKQVEEADRERRLGEDLLFASGHFRDNALTHLTKAQAGYVQAGAIAAEVRNALELRDRVMADFPYYAQWMTRRPGRVPESSLERAKQLADATHQLSQRLAQPGPDTDNLRKLRQEMETNFRALSEEKDTVTRDSLNAGQRVQSEWDEIQALLSVPLAKPAERIGLLKELGRVAARLGEAASQEAASPTETGRATGEQTEDRVREQALRQERMALAVLGDVVPPVAPQAAWRSQAAVVGKAIGSTLQALPGRIDRLTGQALTENLNDAARDSKEAAGLARYLDGAGAQTLTHDPCAENRAVNLHQLLVWQAQRAFQDHWWSEDQKAKPYYKLACEAYLHDAKELATPQSRELEESKKGIRLSQVNALQNLLAHTKEWGFTEAPRHLDLTSDPVATVRFRLEASEALVPAFPVLWRRIDPSLLAVQADKANERFPKVEFGGDKPVTGAEESFEVINKALDEEERKPVPTPHTQSTKVGLTLLCRGRIITSEPTLTIHHGVDVTVLHHPDPPYAGLAMWTDKPTLERLSLSHGALDIVVDYSGSMGGTRRGDRKIDQALAALRDVLQDLPEGVRLGVWVFGDRDVLDQSPKESWVRRIWEPRQWHPEQLDELMARLDLQPRSFTPLVRAMTKAAREDLKGFPGPKILLVLTDGMDTRFVKGDYEADRGTTNHTDGDPDFNPGSKGNQDEIPQFLRKEFQDSDITINMVLFDPPVNERERAHRQFEIIEKLPQRGKLYDARDAYELRKNLKLSLVQQLHCKLKRGDRPVGPAEGLKIMLSEENPAWFPGRLDAGQYTGIIRGLSPQPIRLENGDFLYATLTNKGLERTVLGQKKEVAAKRKKTSSGGEWLLAVWQDQLRNDRDRSLQMLATVEKQPGRDEGRILKQVRPKFTWLEVKSQGVERRLSLRCQNLARYPAYAVGLDVPRWPETRDGRRALPELHAWWTSEEPKADARVRLEDVKDASPTSTRVVKLGPEESVTIESVRFVDRPVVQGEDDEKPMPQRCLVVRIRYPQGRPVLARLNGPDLGSQEDRLYQQANTYTGIFWPVQESQTKNLALELISLEKLKAAKDTEKCTLTELPEPDPNEDRGRLQQAPAAPPR